ncbi:catalase family protein [Novosphingobium aquimarinum]|uniref:catalase family protein n=1 Tax=Novosphingobium aquimarinum TaxID=2682494 RepID=UPI0012EBD94D|nr:catalase family protein [Novosphingobium aquimarinum]
MQPPLRYSPNVEVIEENEKEVVDELCDTFDTILETTAKDYGHAVRAVHAKAHGVLEGQLTIDDNLPPELAQGLFAKPGVHKVLARISTNPGDILSDKISLPRGLAIKVHDVEGERLPGAEGTAQDFVMVNSPVFMATSAKKFLGNLKLLAQTTDRMEGAKVALSTVLRGLNSALGKVGIETSALDGLGGARNVDPLGETYYSTTPFRYGDYIAKFSLVPVSPELIALSGDEVDASDDDDAIRTRVRKDMQTIDGTWELRVQLCRDLDKQPVEDPTVEWSEEDTPAQRVAVLTLPHQDSWEEDRVKQLNDEMRFSVWTGLAAHQPLGNVNRARKPVYEHSSGFRQRFNGCPIHEPNGTA